MMRGEVCVVGDRVSIYSTFFGGVTLTGKDAKKFESQVAHGRPNKAAKDAAMRGKTMLAEFQKKGFVTLSLKKRPRT